MAAHRGPGTADTPRRPAGPPAAARLPPPRRGPRPPPGTASHVLTIGPPPRPGTRNPRTRRHTRALSLPANRKAAPQAVGAALKDQLSALLADSGLIQPDNSHSAIYVRTRQGKSSIVFQSRIRRTITRRYRSAGRHRLGLARRGSSASARTLPAASGSAGWPRFGAAGAGTGAPSRARPRPGRPPRCCRSSPSGLMGGLQSCAVLCSLVQVLLI